MNNIVSFARPEAVEISDAAIALAKAIVVNEIGPDELFAAVDLVSSVWEAEE